jgi:uncharacterized protein YegL
MNKKQLQEVRDELAELESSVEKLKARLEGTRTTRILVVQDKSGSMGDRRKETISGFNEYLEGLQEDKSDKAYLTLIQFDTSSKTVYEAMPVDKVEPLSNRTYVPMGGTALLDAVGQGLTSLERQMNEGDRALVVIMTDGEENSSWNWSRSKVQSKISELEEEDRYTFVFMGAGKNAWTGGDMLGLRRQQSVFYGESAHTHSLAYAGLSGMTSGLRGGTQMKNEASGTVTSAAIADLGGEVEQEPTPLWTPGSEDKQDKDDKSGE